MLSCLDKVAESKQELPDVDFVVLNDAAIVQMLHPGQSCTSLHYARDVFVPYIISQLLKVLCLNVVWDQYFAGSLMATTRAK